MLPPESRIARLASLSDNAKEIPSGAVREIEPQLRELFTKVVEHDPHEAVKMLEPYPDEFVVQMLELLNPASALNILQFKKFGGDPATASRIVVTTFTDVGCLAVFLGLARLLI